MGGSQVLPWRTGSPSKDPGFRPAEALGRAGMGFSCGEGREERPPGPGWLVFQSPNGQADEEEFNFFQIFIYLFMYMLKILFI